MKSAVTLIFFNRPDTLFRVFEKIKLAKPPVLFLIQDGARKGNLVDEQGIKACQQIVEDIDWDCKVYKNYSETNLGCGVRPQSGITWVLSQVDRTIILEDDCVPDMSFFDYCDELLEKYQYDDRIAYICGMNHFEEWDFGNSSYGFTKGGGIGGWATWQRAWKRYDYSVGAIHDQYVESLMRENFIGIANRISLWKRTNKLVSQNTKISYWDVQWGFVKYSQNQLAIVPKYNLISHIGIGDMSTHATTGSLNHKKYKDFNNMPVRPLEFPLLHPQHMLCDVKYDKLLIKCNKKARNRMFINAIKNKIKKIIGR